MIVDQTQSDDDEEEREFVNRVVASSNNDLKRRSRSPSIDSSSSYSDDEDEVEEPNHKKRKRAVKIIKRVKKTFSGNVKHSFLGTRLNVRGTEAGVGSDRRSISELHRKYN